jgi:hypothetical protein
VEDEKLQGKISDEDKTKILDKCNEIIAWLDKNQVQYVAVPINLNQVITYNVSRR